jgi:hypothetical protein
MGSFLGQPSAVDLLSANEDLIYDYSITINTATSTFAPSVNFGFSINITLYSFSVNSDAFYERLVAGSNVTYRFKINVSQELRNFFDNNTFFNATRLTTATNEFIFTVSVRANDYLPDANGILTFTPSVTANDIKVLNTLQTDLSLYQYTATDIDFMTKAIQSKKVFSSTEYKLFVYGNATINAVRFETLDRFLNVIDEGVVSLVNTNNINVLDLDTDGLNTYTFVDGNIPTLDDEVKYVRVTAGNWDGIAYTKHSIDRLFEYVWRRCDLLEVEFQNDLGVTEKVYFDRFDIVENHNSLKYYEPNVGNLKLSGEVTTVYNVTKENLTVAEMNYLSLIFKSGIIRLTYNDVQFSAVIETEKTTFKKNFDNSYSLVASFEQGLIDRTFNN